MFLYVREIMSNYTNNAWLKLAIVNEDNTPLMMIWIGTTDYGKIGNAESINSTVVDIYTLMNICICFYAWQYCMHENAWKLNTC